MALAANHTTSWPAAKARVSKPLSPEGHARCHPEIWTLVFQAGAMCSKTNCCWLQLIALAPEGQDHHRQDVQDVWTARVTGWSYVQQNICCWLQLVTLAPEGTDRHRPDVWTAGVTGWSYVQQKHCCWLQLVTLAPEGNNHHLPDVWTAGVTGRSYVQQEHLLLASASNIGTPRKRPSPPRRVDRRRNRPELCAARATAVGFSQSHWHPKDATVATLISRTLDPWKDQQPMVLHT